MPTHLPRVARESIPVAKPATPALPIDATDGGPVDSSWLTPEVLRGWGSSLTLHGVILLAMALLYFAPKGSTPRSFDTRLAGSEMGVEEGLSATGGLNTPLEMAASTDSPAEPVSSSFKPLELEAPDAKLSSLSGASKPSGGGGMDNPNPGAGEGDGFGLARFGQGGESVQGIEVKVGDPQFTLIWDTEVDLDLHVIEPGGKEIYWEDPKGKRGGELDVDNTKGFGPENVYWLSEVEGSGERVKGAGPPGEYKWFVVYWGGFGGVPKLTKWKVRIKHDGKVSVVTGKLRAINEKSKIHTLKVDGTNQAAVEATSTR